MERTGENESERRREKRETERGKRREKSKKREHSEGACRARQRAVTRVVKHEKGRICLFLSALGAWCSVVTYTAPGCDHVFRATACRSQTMMGSL